MKKMKRRRKMKRRSGGGAKKRRSSGNPAKRNPAPVFKEILKGGKYELTDFLKEMPKQFGQELQSIAMAERDALISGLVL